jgi:hypothetical protein
MNWPKFLTYGNWGGPGWSGGKFVHDPKLVDWSVPAIDEMDELFKQHDLRYQTDGNRQEADKILLRELKLYNPKGLRSNIYYWGVIFSFNIKIFLKF